MYFLLKYSTFKSRHVCVRVRVLFYYELWSDPIRTEIKKKKDQQKCRYIQHVITNKCYIYTNY